MEANMTDDEGEPISLDALEEKGKSKVQGLLDFIKP